MNRRRLVVAAWMGIACCAAPFPADACSMFSVTSGDHALMANNEDYVEPGQVWFVPAGKGRHGRVNFGFADRFAQGGMNDQGLAFDAAVVGEVPYRPERGKQTPKNLIEEIMDECATVEQAIEYFRTFNCPHLSRSQFMFADRSGASVVIAWLPDRGLSVVRREGSFQLITNTRLEASSFRCERHVLGTRRLAAATTHDAETVRGTLEAMHQRGGQAFTSYSNVYDLTAGTVTVYNLADFGRPVTFNLAEELARGEHAYDLATLSEAPGRLDELRGSAPRSFDTAIPLTAQELVRFAGSYRIAGAGDDLRIELVDGALVLLPPDGSRAGLYPEGPALFRIRAGGQIRFDIGASGSARALTLYRFGDHRAERVD